MKHALKLLSVLCLVAMPAVAEDQDAPPEGEGPGDGYSLMEEGARLFLRGLMDEVDPAMENLRDLAGEMTPAMREFLHEMGPALADLLGKVEDITNYYPPEMLPNGDIILRRKPDTEPQPGPPEPGGEIEL
ncbi:hypothetical protein [Sediminimonas qiaohouensis]|uniref:hypothetical protein n=1 Tax=Sediminimonas qiaohouensis TaxID=552061 RepID=UPI00041CD2EA|nr:hypothetical protein [Sediminimonas qiaohouensis]